MAQNGKKKTVKFGQKWGKNDQKKRAKNGLQIAEKTTPPPQNGAKHEKMAKNGQQWVNATKILSKMVPKWAKNGQKGQNESKSEAKCGQNNS